MTRSGIGYDVHRLIEGRPLVLGGVTLDYHLGLDGHSDADVLAHAVADAVLGAVGAADIGHYFPPGIPETEGIDSMDILRKAAKVVAEKGGKLVNVDCTLIAEAPKIRPHVDSMKANMGKALGLDPDFVGVKATTNERLGFPGREEGMAAIAIAAVEFP